MSHFNLNNGMPRKRYIGPTHGLACRPGTASLENLGGRIIIENEMHNHKLRLKQIKPSIDSSKPWAHSYQDTKLRQSPTREGRENSPSNQGGANSPSLPPATRNGGMRSQSAQQKSRSGTSMSSTYPTKGPNTSTSKTAAAGPPGTGHQGRPFDVTALPADHQGTYKSLVQLLSTLPQKEAKTLLEQAYREGEERKLLMAYTGAFPEATKSSASSRPPSSRARDETSAAAQHQHHSTVASSVASSARKPAASSAAASTGEATPLAQGNASTSSRNRAGPKSPLGSVSPRSSASNSRTSSPREASPKKVVASTPKGRSDGYDSFEEEDK